MQITTRITKAIALLLLTPAPCSAGIIASQTFTIPSSGPGSVGYLPFTLSSPTTIDIAASGSPGTDSYIFLFSGTGNFSTAITLDDDGCDPIDCGAGGASIDYNSLINDLSLSSGTYTVATGFYPMNEANAISGQNATSYSGQILVLVGDADLIIPGTGTGTGTTQLVTFSGTQFIPTSPFYDPSIYQSPSGFSLITPTGSTQLTTSSSTPAYDPLTNAGSTAVATNDLCSSTQNTSTLANCAAIALARFSPGGQAAVVEQITPEEIHVIAATTVATSRGNFNAVQERIAQLKAGHTGGFQISGANIGAASSDDLPEIFKQLGVFANIDGGFGSKSVTANEQGYSFDTQAVTVGVDYAFNDAFVAGLAFNNTHNNANFVNQAGQLYTASFSGSLFSSFNWNDFYIDTLASVGGLDYNAERQMSFFNAAATGVTTGMQYASSMTIGYNHQIQEIILNPYAGIDYIKTDVAGFSETGGAGFAVNYANQNIESLLSKVGARASYTLSFPWGVITPQVNAEWLHESSYNASISQVRFVQNPNTSFEIHSDAPDRDFMRAGVNVAGQFANGISGFVSYNSLLERENVDSHSFSTGIRMEF